MARKKTRKETRTETNTESAAEVTKAAPVQEELPAVAAPPEPVAAAEPAVVEATPAALPEVPEAVEATPAPLPEAPEAVEAAPVALPEVPEAVEAAPAPVPEAPEAVEAAPAPVPEAPEAVEAAPAPVPEAPEAVEAAPAPVPELSAAAEVAPTEPSPLDGETVSTPESAPFPPKDEAPAGARPRLGLRSLEPAEIERSLREVLDTVERLANTPGAAAEEVKRVANELGGKLGGDKARAAANDLFSQMGRVVAARTPATEAGDVDDFGRDPAFESGLLSLFEPIYRYWFRVETKGLEGVPSNGPVILVANHSGAVPFDMAMLKTALALEHPARRTLRPLAENFSFHFPFVGTWLNRFGVVRACPENAEALLARGEAVAVFPEGAKGPGKTFDHRYKLQRFGRGGAVKLAMRTGAPIVPVAIVGAEETYPLLARVVRPVAPFGLPYFPITPTFPLLGPAGLLPLPTKWTIEFGEPIRYDAGDVDELTIEKRTEDLRAGLQGRIDRLVDTRVGIFF